MTIEGLIAQAVDQCEDGGPKEFFGRLKGMVEDQHEAFDCLPLRVLTVVGERLEEIVDYLDDNTL